MAATVLVQTNVMGESVHACCLQSVYNLHVWGENMQNNSSLTTELNSWKYIFTIFLNIFSLAKALYEDNSA